MITRCVCFISAPRLYFSRRIYADVIWERHQCLTNPSTIVYICWSKTIIRLLKPQWGVVYQKFLTYQVLGDLAPESVSESRFDKLLVFLFTPALCDCLKRTDLLSDARNSSSSCRASSSGITSHPCWKWNKMLKLGLRRSALTTTISKRNT